MSSPTGTADSQAQDPSQPVPHRDSTATSNSPRVWFISSACSPLVVRLIRRLLAHGDYIAAALPPHELDDPIRSLDFRTLIAECQDASLPGSRDDEKAGWKDRIRSIQADGRSMGQCGAAVAEAIDAFGRIDIVLCCNSEAIIGTVEELAASPASRNLVQDQFETIFFSQVNLIKASLPTLRSQHNGHIVLLTSIGGHIGTPEMSIHTAATWAIEGFCDSLAYEIAPFNIRLTIVQPHKEISMLTNRIVFAPPLTPQHSTARSDAHMSVPSVRSMLARVLSLDPQTALPSPSGGLDEDDDDEEEEGDDDDEEEDDGEDDEDEDGEGTATAGSLGSPGSPAAASSSAISETVQHQHQHQQSTSSASSTSSNPARAASSQQQQEQAQPPPPPPRSTTTTTTTSSSSNNPSGPSARIIQRYSRLPEASLDALVNETVTALIAIGGHENPPARHIVGFEGAEAVKEKLRTVTEELEDFVEASIAVDITEEEDFGGGRGSVSGMAGTGFADGAEAGPSGSGAGGSGAAFGSGGGGEQMDWDGGSLW